MSAEFARKNQETHLIQLAMHGRCPRCGSGSLFSGYLKVANACSVCGLGLEGHDTGDGPAFFIILPLCIVVATLALVVESIIKPPTWIHIIAWPILVLVISGLSLRPVKALMIALQYRYRDVEREDEVRKQ